MPYENSVQLSQKTAKTQQATTPEFNLLIVGDTIQILPKKKLTVDIYQNLIDSIKYYKNNSLKVVPSFKKEEPVSKEVKSNIPKDKETNLSASLPISSKFERAEIKSGENLNELPLRKCEPKKTFTLPKFAPDYIDSANHFIPAEKGDFTNRKVATKQPVFENTKLTINFKISEKDWMLWYVIGALTLFIFIRFVYKKILFGTLQSVYNKNTALRMSNENNQLSFNASFLLKLLFTINISLFSLQTLSQFDAVPETISPFNVTLLFILAWGVIYTVKYALTSIVGFVTDTKDLVKLYLYNTSLLNKVYGLILFPFILSIPYLEFNILSPKHLIIVGWLLFATMYILRISKGIMICIRQKVSLFYTILYLCTLELIPLALLYKIIESYAYSQIN